MSWLMKIFMGGWIPEGQRTQWMAFAVAMGAVAVAVVEWGSGAMDITTLFTLLAEKWEIFGVAFMAYFLGEKVDAVKEKV